MIKKWKRYDCTLVHRIVDVSFMIRTDTIASSYTTWKYYVVSQSMTNVGAGVDETRENEEGENYFYLW